MKALVTGGAGFIGHHLVRTLLGLGWEVVVLDDFSSGLRERLDPYRDDMTVVEGSVTDSLPFEQASDGCEVIFHEAAVASVERSFTHPVSVNDVNVNGTIQAVTAASRQGVRRVVVASSAAVYGVPEQLPCRESTRPDPISPYGAGKLAAEGYLHSLGRQLGVETVALRYFNVYGPGQDPASEYSAVIPLFVQAILDGRRPIINGDGDISRDFVFVDDVVSANLLAATAPSAVGATMNIATGRRSSLLDLLGAIAAASGATVEPEFGPHREGDIAHSVADISLARSLTGYAPKVPFDEGIRRTVSWQQAQRLGSD